MTLGSFPVAVFYTLVHGKKVSSFFVFDDFPCDENTASNMAHNDLFSLTISIRLNTLHCEFSISMPAKFR